MTRDDVQAGLAAVEAMTLEELRIAWVRRVKSSPPKISAGLLRLALAHAPQSKMRSERQTRANWSPCASAPRCR
jgi:hypothetical protein